MKKIVSLLSFLIACSTQLHCMNQTTFASRQYRKTSDALRKNLAEQQRALIPTRRAKKPLISPQISADHESLRYSQEQAVQEVIEQANQFFPKRNLTIAPKPSDTEPVMIGRRLKNKDSRTSPACCRYTDTEELSPTGVTSLLSPTKIRFASPISTIISQSLDGTSEFIGLTTPVSSIFRS